LKICSCNPFHKGKVNKIFGISAVAGSKSVKKVDLEVENQKNYCRGVEARRPFPVGGVSVFASLWLLAALSG